MTQSFFEMRHEHIRDKRHHYFLNSAGDMGLEIVSDMRLMTGLLLVIERGQIHFPSSNNDMRGHYFKI